MSKADEPADKGPVAFRTAPLAAVAHAGALGDQGLGPGRDEQKLHAHGFPYGV